jgi:hypothetical protein
MWSYIYSSACTLCVTLQVLQSRNTGLLLKSMSCCMVTSSNRMNRTTTTQAGLFIATYCTAGTHTQVYYITRMSPCPLAFVHTCPFLWHRAVLTTAKAKGVTEKLLQCFMARRNEKKGPPETGFCFLSRFRESLYSLFWSTNGQKQ